MADQEKEVERTSRGADWEVVSLTASTYAAAPGPNTPIEGEEELNQAQQESPGELFVSKHFAIPSDEHGNPSAESQPSEIHFENEGEEVSGMEDKDFAEDKGVQKFNLGSEGGGGGEEHGSISHDLDESRSKSEFAPKDTKQHDEDKLSGSAAPCGSWWKKHVSCLYRHAKEANALCFVVVTAALVGLVILGQRWQKDKLKLHQLKLWSNASVRG